VPGRIGQNIQHVPETSHRSCTGKQLLSRSRQTLFLKTTSISRLYLLFSRRLETLKTTAMAV